ncbi:regulator of volume decrease after cellular swelling-domain-containing protein [Aspergillus pseudodeflectus]|uniref:Regulator of volume decrease after cellular swelling-domain-containing protein n=1 Tax=Aspergillus pseudodeflectus TaxID=176178 RepID=A0ABR4L5A1_9EURO
MEPLTSAPDTSSFTPLSVHQSRTPESFHSGPAILHYHASRCSLVALERDVLATPALNALCEPGAGAGTAANGTHLESSDADADEKEILIEGVDVWVTSDKFLLYNSSTSSGLSIPYPSISLHAIQRLKLPSQQAGSEHSSEVQGLYMHITKPPSASYPQVSDEEESLEVTLVPPTQPTAPSTEPQGESAPEPEAETETEIQKLYAAVSACSNLHPDPAEEEDEEGGAFASGLVFPGSAEDGGLPPPVDGSSGWITADNMHEFFDEEGNWIGGGDAPTLPGLGPGAGTVRGREEGADEGEGDGEGADDGDETKWRRTD